MSLIVNMLVAIIWTILLQNHVTCQSCTPVEYPPFLDRHVDFNGNPPVQVLHPVRFIILSYLFGCYGTVTRWELYTVNNGSHPIEFQVWRDDTRISRSSTLSLIGTNYFPAAQPNSNNFLSLPVPREQQIKVQPGDRLGIVTFENNSTNDFRIQDYIFQGTVVFYELGGAEENPITPDSISFVNANVRFSPIHFLPVMNVTVVPAGSDLSGCSQPAEGTTLSQPSGPTPLPQSTVIAIASSAAIVVLLSTVLLITIVICCCMVGKREKGTPVKPHPPSQDRTVELDYNPAYQDGYHNDHINYEHHEQTEPYYSLVTEEQGGVSDTRDSYVEIQPNYAAHTK